MAQLLQLHHVSKSYRGKKAIDDLTVTIPSGKIIGLLDQMEAAKQPLSN